MSVTVQNSALFENTSAAFSHQSNQELKKAYRLFRSFSNPLLLPVGKALIQIAFNLNAPIEGLFKKTIYHQFCGGESLHDCKRVIHRLADNNISTALQYSVETKATEEEYNRTMQELLDAIYYSESNPHVKVVCCKLTGIGSFNIFEKLHGGTALSGSEEVAFENIRRRMETICSVAEKASVAIFFDAEESWIQRPMDQLIDEMMLRYNKQQAVVYNTFQLYRNDRLDFLKASFEKARANKFILGAKLVRGAYMEKERKRARNKNLPSPIHQDKQAVDKAYNEALEFCAANFEGIAFCAATHNEQSCLRLVNLIDSKGIDRNHPNIFFSQLYGMGEHLTYNLAKEGFNATKLVPYGPVREAIPYLIRRAEENSSVAGQVGRELQLLKKEMKRRGLM